eukprot:gb/GFBE01045425.1/.p1 GENE.gb/GFBE01045425.1/~~gb/GFBE01045425.1/.p1  ORF type:complete len:305 (+),score=69.54 gb/GFBE01045425.1/:1-915(+)
MAAMRVAAALLVVLGVSADTIDLEDAAKALTADDECHAIFGEEAASCEVSLRQLRGRQAEELSGQDAEEERYDDEDLELLSVDDIDLNNESSWAETGRNIRTLYHQTSPAAAASILRTGFRPGSARGICGSAIYFSPTPHDTDWKAVGGRGKMIKAVVDLGRVKWMGRECDRAMNGPRLKSLGYDSITLDRGGYIECRRVAHCREYIIYDPRRVLHMTAYNYHGWKHWYSKNAEANETGVEDAAGALGAHAPTDDSAETPQDKAANAAAEAADAAADFADAAAAAAERAADAVTKIRGLPFKTR